MVNHIVAPVDGSPEGWNGAAQAFELARQIGVPVTLMSVEVAGADRDIARKVMAEGVRSLDAMDVDVEIVVRVSAEGIAEEIVAEAAAHHGSVIVMSSHGRGRSAAIVGSVADDIVRRSEAPVMVIGPSAQPRPITGHLLITVDGSEVSERAAPVGLEWAAALELEPWIVNTAPGSGDIEDVVESGYVAGLAHQAHAETGQAVQFEQLHGDHAAREVTSFAKRTHTGLIAASTHGRTGFRRVTLGSVAAGFVANAPCPVLLVNGGTS